MENNWQNEAEDIAQAVQRVTDHFLAMHGDFDSEPIAKNASPELAHWLQQYASPEDRPRTINEVVKEAFTVSDYRMRMNHPRSFSFIPAPVSPLAWLGDMIFSMFNAHAGSRIQSSGPSAIEHGLVQWMASKAGLPAATAGGLSVSGGSMANLTAMILSRDHNLPRHMWSTGIAYVSDQTHSSIAKGLRILGFQDHQVRQVVTDAQFRMDTGALQYAIDADRKNGLYPFMIVATCGTTNTGSIDLIEEIVDLARQKNLWVHIDGAYGASALLAESQQHRLKGLDGVDSISWDAHKWLFQTYGCGFVLVRDKSLLQKSFHTSAEYTQDATEIDDIPNFWNLGVELTRPTRAMRLWFTLRVLGLDKVNKMLEHGIQLAEHAEKQVRMLPDWHIMSPASLAITTFRFAPPRKTELELDELNTRISQRLIAENVAGMLTTKVNGKVVLRICSISPRLSKSAMDIVLKRMHDIGQELVKGT